MQEQNHSLRRRHRPAPFVANASIAILLAGLAACSHRSINAVEGSLQVPADTKVVAIEVQNGSVRLKRGPAGQIAYRGDVRRSAESAEQLARLDALPAAFTAAPDPAQPGRLVVQGPRVEAAELGPNFLAVEAELTLPPGVDVTLAIAGSGHIEAEGLEGSLDLATRRGDLRLMRCSGSTVLRTSQGMTIVYDHRGDLDIKATLGDMQVFVREPGKVLRLVTGQGNVQCLIPADTGFRLDARAQTGKVANGFGFPVDQSSYTGVMVGDRGDQRTQIVLRTEKGHLSLSHKTFD
jgi:hypothetical protein